MTKNSRESEHREHDVREPHLINVYESELDSIAGMVKRPGYKLRWVNYALRNEPTMGVEKASRQGWELVKRDRLPNYIGDILGRNPVATMGITSGDVILMEIKDEIYERYAHAVNQKAQAAVASLKTVAQDRGTLNDVTTEIRSFHA